MTEWWSKIRCLFGGRRRVADDLQAEIDAHLQYEVEDKLAAGMTGRAAEQAARRAFRQRDVDDGVCWFFFRHGELLF